MTNIWEKDGKSEEIDERVEKVERRKKKRELHRITFLCSSNIPLSFMHKGKTHTPDIYEIRQALFVITNSTYVEEMNIEQCITKDQIALEKLISDNAKVIKVGPIKRVILRMLGINL